MAKKYVGIDIGTYNIKMANVTVAKDSIVIDTPVVVRTPEFLVRNGRILSRNELAGLLKDCIAGNRFISRKAIVILNDSIVVTRDIHLPAGTPKELDDMIRMDASEYLPFDISEYTLRYRVLVPAAQNPKNTNYALMASIKNDLAMDFYQVFRMAGLNPTAIDITVNSMVKYLKQEMKASSEGNPGKNAAIIDFGATTTKMIILQGEVPVFQQIISNNPKKIDVMLSTLLNLERSKAEEYKIRYGLDYVEENEADGTAKSVRSIIQNQVDLLLSDVYKHIQTFASRNNINIELVILTGGLSMMRGFRGYVEAVFGIPCSLARPGKAVSFLKTIKGNNSAHEEAELFACFTNIAGAAIRSD